MNSEIEFEAIASEHYVPLFRFALSLARGYSDAQDLTQQTFYVWATKGHQLRDRSKVKTWLFTTLYRAFLEGQNKRVRFQHYEMDDVSDELPTVAPVSMEKLDSSQVVSALAQVDPLFRAPVTLFYLEDYSYRQIAEILTVPVGTIKSRIARGILQLRTAVGGIDQDQNSARRGRSSFSARASAPTRTSSAPARPGEARRLEPAGDVYPV
jgi:RNA polymerase sigma factor (sigma-70 family)